MLVAEAVGRVLAQLGPRHVFGLIGSGNFAVTNAMVAAGQRFVAARHEGGAISMADAYAQVTGGLGMCTVHQGPGLTNTMTGLTEAAKSRTPLVLVAADTAAAAVRSNFRIGQDQLVDAVGALFERVQSAESAVADATRAVHTAMLKRRPVVLMLPLDVQAMPCEPPPTLIEGPVAIPPRGPAREVLERVVEALVGARRPLIIAGRGARVSGAKEVLQELAEASGALLATSAVGNGLFADSPWALGISGGFASPVAAGLIGEADVVLGFGVALNMWTTRHSKLLGARATVIQVDDDADALGAHHRVDIGVVGDAAETARALLVELHGRRGGASRLAASATSAARAGLAPAPISGASSAASSGAGFAGIGGASSAGIGGAGIGAAASGVAGSVGISGAVIGPATGSGAGSAAIGGASSASSSGGGIGAADSSGARSATGGGAGAAAVGGAGIGPAASGGAGAAAVGGAGIGPAASGGAGSATGGGADSAASGGAGSAGSSVGGIGPGASCGASAGSGGAGSATGSHGGGNNAQSNNAATGNDAADGNDTADGNRAGETVATWRTAEMAARIRDGSWHATAYDDASTDDRIDPRTLSRALDEILPRERTVAIDSGHFMGYPAMYLRVPDERGFVFTQAFQAVGLGLGTAIGAAVARPDRLTVAALGDGGAMIGLADLETVARIGLRMLIVIYNDAAYGAEVHHFGPHGHPLDLVRFPDVDFAALGRAVGLQGMTVRRKDDLHALHSWLEQGATPGMVLDAKVVPTVVAEWLEEAFRGH